jgi:hypothetical protein
MKDNPKNKEMLATKKIKIMGRPFMGFLLANSQNHYQY